MTVDRVATHARAGELAAAAWEFSRYAYPSVDFGSYDDRLTEMASRVEGRGHLPLRRVVSIHAGLGGDVDDYYHPRNSYLHEVLDRRKGIPISLSVIWIEVGRRAGMEVQGVGLPGHFLVYADGQLCDPFHGGEAIGRDEAAALVASSMGGPPRVDRSWLEPIPDDLIVERMLRNLSSIYTQRDEPDHRRWIDDCLAALGEGPTGS